MKLPFGFLLLAIYLTRTEKQVSGTDINEGKYVFKGYHLLMPLKTHSIQRRDSANVIESEGGTVTIKQPIGALVPTVPANPDSNLKGKIAENPKSNGSLPTVINTTSNKTADITPVNASTVPQVVSTTSDVKVNATITEKATSTIDVNNPGVLKRGSIVFGGFALLAVAYYVFYKRKGKGSETNTMHGNNESNQFRYGVLQSDDRRDNLELSRIPLTIESDDDEDEDLHVYDIEDRRKNMSYVNLQTRDEDIVHTNKEEKNSERDDLLLDIDDGSPDTSMDWMVSSSKSIL